MRIVLEAHGLSEKAFSAVYLKPEFTFEKLRNGQLDGFAVMAGVPMEGVSRIADLGLHIVPVAPEQAVRIHQTYPYLFFRRDPRRYLSGRAGQHRLRAREIEAQDDLRRAERSLRENEEKYRLLFEKALDGIFIAQEGFIKFPNPSVLKLMELTTPPASIPFVDLIHPEDRDMVADYCWSMMRR